MDSSDNIVEKVLHATVEGTFDPDDTVKIEARCIRQWENDSSDWRIKFRWSDPKHSTVMMQRMLYAFPHKQFGKAGLLAAIMRTLDETDLTSDTSESDMAWGFDRACQALPCEASDQVRNH